MKICCCFVKVSQWFLNYIFLKQQLAVNKNAKKFFLPNNFFPFRTMCLIVFQLIHIFWNSNAFSFWFQIWNAKKNCSFWLTATDVLHHLKDRTTYIHTYRQTDRQIDRQRNKEDGQIKSILTNVRPKIKISRSRQTFLNFNLNKSKGIFQGDNQISLATFTHWRSSNHRCE